MLFSEISFGYEIIFCVNIKAALNKKDYELNYY